MINIRYIAAVAAFIFYSASYFFAPALERHDQMTLRDVSEWHRRYPLSQSSYSSTSLSADPGINRKVKLIHENLDTYLVSASVLGSQANTFADGPSIPSHENENIFLSMLLAVAFLMTLFWLWMLIDCLVKESDEGNTKLIWVGMILVTGWLGAILYFILRRPQRKSELGK
jgi:uncharacterized membrane protein YbaN (DUF454 family)